MTEFGFDLLNQITDETIVFSPLSLQIALAMTAAGARGSTLEEMREVLHLKPSFIEDMNKTRKHLSSIAKKSKASLDISNGLFPAKSLVLKEEYVRTVTTLFKSTLSSMDYSTDPEQSRAHINQTIKKLTKGMIEKLLPPGSINGDTRLVLTNAIHFLGKWKKPFTSVITRPFKSADGSLPAIKYIACKQYRAHYSSTDQWAAVSIPYKGWT
eukprot:gnl/Dysnectes_brevis/6461_a10042_320.p1 GENE.gnl/Dysnectes_brevis/6461_a10042_320~~gnl/Dysnectes_brevis/6461_a10042_320.p1  ORF type:complete len:212 (+),score=49.44 gnl/Dysnectes_brevis/6461_a10042_320:47-682(+)